MITLEPYQLVDASFSPWRPIYLDVAQALSDHISTPRIEVLHFGSTSAKVGGKGIIDLSILYFPGEREKAIIHLYALGFQDQHSKQPFPEHRPRKDASVIYQDERFLVHAHVIEKDSDEHHRQIAYKQYLLDNPSVRIEYENKKRAILAQGVRDQDAYVKQKAPFVKGVLAEL
ncbi:GrpB family protein [Salinivibrio kushneri]|uniref:GrpB family protein n=1 Tax=Salinivibrio kushneri TaxID=1908198 RepID=UPI000986377D|nr:GrpB family protein [Salinivibrio kushneri]OOE48049.1 hypothetical protein BZG10_12215 [Salinivibrio kushneri]OOE48387.1 hypothetical protein BZG11_14885 [Salinivibrio kushneri]OOE60872.1 hypothetical protein BZG18_10445 [Salinivibrio kushneri]